ncbi:MAG TPA: hypothetical protein VMP08_08300 [Anaerolineae bacterium]|nr:hypothetical protein [Anaerolineae bacterium]
MRFMRWISLLAIVGLLATGLLTTQVATAQQQNVGEICVRAFNDINGDGTYTAPDEPLLADVTFILSNETGRLASYRTDGTEVDKPYCFGSLAVGQYTVQARPDVNKVKGKATTPGQWVVPLAGGAQYDIAYGMNLGEQSSGSNQASSGSTSSGGMSTVGRIALGLLGVGVLGVAGFLAYSILRRARSA